MKRPPTFARFRCLGLLFAASTCLAQMYTITDLGTLGGTSSWASGINSSGQVVGFSNTTDDRAVHAFRTAANRPISPATDDLGTLGGTFSFAQGVNDSGEVVGLSNIPENLALIAFRTAPNQRINPATDSLGTLGGGYSDAFGINSSGQAAGAGFITGQPISHAFRTGPNRAVNPASDDLGSLGADYSFGYGINDSGQVVGMSFVSDTDFHGFRTAANSPINSATDDLGTLGGTYSYAFGINASGQVVGYGTIAGNVAAHAFRTAPNRPINPLTDDLGTLGGLHSFAGSINSFGEVPGLSFIAGDTAIHAFLYSNGVMHDLNLLIPSDSSCALTSADEPYPAAAEVDINDTGQIAANASCGGQQHAVLLTPIYKGSVRPPINSDGSSIFRAKRGVIPVKFRLSQYSAPTCTLLPATITVGRTDGNTSAYVTRVVDGAPFRIDSSACQYIYNLSAAPLVAGKYRVDISINGIFVGHAAFALR